MENKFKIENWNPKGKIDPLWKSPFSQGEHRSWTREENKIIIYNSIVYILSKEQYERLIEVQEEAKNLPFGAEMHIEEHLNFNIENYKSIGEIDFDFDEPYS